MRALLVIALVACNHEGAAFVEQFPHGATTASPLVVVLHGLGGSPEKIAPLLDGFPVAAEIALPRGFYAEDEGWSWFPWPDAPSLDVFAQMIDDTDARLWPALVTLAHGRPIVVVGFSQGGMMAYALAAHHPAEIVAAFPIAGFLPPKSWPHARTAPVYAWHGTADEVVPIERERATVAAFKAAGGSAELREEPGVGHVWWPMREDVIAHVRAALRL